MASSFFNPFVPPTFKHCKAVILNLRYILYTIFFVHSLLYIYSPRIILVTEAKLGDSAYESSIELADYNPARYDHAIRYGGGTRPFIKSSSSAYIALNAFLS